MPAVIPNNVSPRGVKNLQAAIAQLERLNAPATGAAGAVAGLPDLDPALIAAAPVAPNLSRLPNPPPVVMSAAPATMQEPDPVLDAPRRVSTIKPPDPLVLPQRSYAPIATPVRATDPDAPVRDVRGEAKRTATGSLIAAVVGGVLGGGNGATAAISGYANGAQNLNDALAGETQTEYENLVRQHSRDYETRQAKYAGDVRQQAAERDSDQAADAALLKAHDAKQEAYHFAVKNEQAQAKIDADAKQQGFDNDQKRQTSAREFITGLSNLSKDGQQQALKIAAQSGQLKTLGLDTAIPQNADGSFQFSIQTAAAAEKDAALKQAQNKQVNTAVQAKLTQAYSLFKDARTTGAGRIALGKLIMDLEGQLGVKSDSPLKADFLADMTPQQKASLAMAEKNFKLRETSEGNRHQEAMARAVKSGVSGVDGGDLLKAAGSVTAIRNRMAVVDGKIAPLRGKTSPLTTAEAAQLKSLRGEKWTLNQKSSLLKQAVGPAGAALFGNPGPEPSGMQAQPPGDAAHHLLNDGNALTTKGSASVALLPSDFTERITGISKMGGKLQITVPADVDAKNPFVIVHVGGKGGTSNNPEYNNLVRLADQNDLQVGYSKARKGYVLTPKGSGDGSVSAPNRGTVRTFEYNGKQVPYKVRN